MKIRSRVAVAPLLICFSAAVLAATDPQELNWGSVKVIPTIKVTEKYDDNLFLSDVFEEDAWITQFEPTVEFLSQQNANIYVFSYEGDYALFDGASDDNYDDHTFAGDLHLENGSKARLDLLGSYGLLHDDRGTGASEGIGGLVQRDPDEYDRWDLAATLDLGSESAMFGLALDASVADIEYQNNLDQTKFRDRQDTKAGATLSVRIAPKTSLILEGSFTEIEYDTLASSGVSLDSEETAILVGATWNITGKTTGSIKLGTTDKEFDDALRGDDDMTTWEVDISWSPRTYSTLFLSSSSTPQETNGTGQFIESTITSVFWVHDWSESLHTQVSFATGEDEFNESTREDDIDRAGFSIDYDFRRWLNVGIGYTFEEKDSNADLFDYEHEIYSISFDLSL